MRHPAARLRLLVDRVTRALHVDVTFLFRRDGPSDELVLVEADGGSAAPSRTGMARSPIDRGLVGRVFATRRPQAVRRYLHATAMDHDCQVDSLAAAEGAVSALAVPLLDDNGPFGCLVVMTRVEREFSDDEVALLSGLADHASAALQAMDLLDEARQLRRQADALVAYPGRLAELREPDALRERLAVFALSTVDADVACVLEHEEQRGGLVVRVAAGVAAPVPDRYALADDTAIAQVARTRVPMVVTDYRTHPDLARDRGLARTVAAEGAISVLAVPMISGCSPPGVLLVASRSARTFAARRVEELTALASYGASTIATAEMRTAAVRRQDELEVLHRSARELVELRGGEPLLSATAARARTLTHSDFAELWVRESGTDELVSRARSGAVADLDPDRHLMPGTGLALMIMRSRAPQQVLRYADLAAALPERDRDRNLVNEGVVSVLGVPLVVDGEVLGFVHVAMRTERRYSEDATNLLSMLADHAATVLLRARRPVEADRRGAAVPMGEVREELIRVALHRGDIGEVASTLASELGRSVTVLDGHRNRLAGHSGEAVAMTSATHAALRSSRDSGRCVGIRSDAASPRPEPYSAAAAVKTGDTVLGALLVGPIPAEPDRSLDASEARTVELAATVIGLLVLREDAAAEAERRLGRQFVADLVSAVPERRRGLVGRARQRGLSLHTMRTLLVVAVEPEARTAAGQAATAWVGDRGLAEKHEDLLVILVPDADPVVAAGALRDAVKHRVPGPVLTVSAPRTSIDTLPERYALAARCARLLLAFGNTDAPVTTDDYLPYTVLFDSDRRALDGFLRSTLGRVLDWDARRGTDLLPTLTAFIDNQASPARTARAMSYHINTIAQRLNRLSELLGSDWRDPEPYFRISVAVRLQGMRGARPSARPTGDD